MGFDKVPKPDPKTGRMEKPNIRDAIIHSRIPEIMRHVKEARTDYLIKKKKQYKPKLCYICSHANADDIDIMILKQMPPSVIYEHYLVSEHIVARHWQTHVQPVVRKILIPTEGDQRLSKTATRMLRSRAFAQFPLTDRVEQLKFMLEDFLLIRKIHYGDVDKWGFVLTHGPNIRGIMDANKEILKVGKELAELNAIAEANEKATGQKSAVQGLAGQLIGAADMEEINRLKERIAIANGTGTESDNDTGDPAGDDAGRAVFDVGSDGVGSGEAGDRELEEAAEISS